MVQSAELEWFLLRGERIREVIEEGGGGQQ